MIVADLLRKLSKLPPDAPVRYEDAPVGSVLQVRYDGRIVWIANYK